VLPLSILLLGIFVYVLNSPASKSYQDVQCQIEGRDACTIQQHGEGFVVAFSRIPEVEEEITLKLTYPDSYELREAWVQGINMYMGRSAILLDSNQKQDGQINSKAMLFLGACSEKNMKWQLVTLFVETASGQELKLFYNFDTQRI
jgi:hypothetical protein